MTCVGIDLGTTFSAVAHVDEKGAATVLRNEHGATLTPSVVCIEGGAPVVGESAKERQAAGRSVGAFFKRQMGQANWVYGAGGNEYSAIDLSAMVLSQLKRDAERSLAKPVREAVITVPAYFRNPEREATIEAGRKAGLSVLQIINEPTAAAVAYGYRPSSESRTVLVYDLGGGTFDVSLLRMEPGETRVLTSDGDHELGGKDWDDRILSFLARSFLDEFGFDPLDDRDSMSDLLVQAEAAKIRLSTVMSAHVVITQGGKRGAYDLDRAGFESLTADLMERTIALTRRVLEEKSVTSSELDGVLLVGGSTRMPMVRDFITRAFGKTPLTGVNVDEAVAIGAAIVASELSGGSGRIGGTRPRKRIIDVTNHSLGMIAVNEDRSAYLNTIILPKDRELPCVESRPYQHNLRRNGASKMEIFVTQGESESPADVSYLGLHLVHDVPAPQGGVALLDVAYAYDASGTVRVSAKLKVDGSPLRVTVEPLPPDVPARFLVAPAQPPPRPHVTAYLAFDLSGSMAGEPILEARRAALGFLKNTDLSNCSLGIVGFSDETRVNLKATQNARKIEKAIGGLTVGDTGLGNAGDPFDQVLSLLGRMAGPRFLVVLADGVWQDQRRAIKRAKACRERGIEIIAIGFGSADREFLKMIASSDEVSFFTSLSGLVDTFCTIAQVMTERPTAASSASEGPERDKPRTGLFRLFGS